MKIPDFWIVPGVIAFFVFVIPVLVFYLLISLLVYPLTLLLWMLGKQLTLDLGAQPSRHSMIVLLPFFTGIIISDGETSIYKFGKLHSLTKPAISRFGREEYYIKGIEMEKAEWEKEVLNCKMRRIVR
jgi:hypothetical protein